MVFKTVGSSRVLTSDPTLNHEAGSGHGWKMSVNVISARINYYLDLVWKVATFDSTFLLCLWKNTSFMWSDKEIWNADGRNSLGVKPEASLDLGRWYLIPMCAHSSPISPIISPISNTNLDNPLHSCQIEGPPWNTLKLVIRWTSWSPVAISRTCVSIEHFFMRHSCPKLVLGCSQKLWQMLDCCVDCHNKNTVWDGGSTSL